MFVSFNLSRSGYRAGIARLTPRFVCSTKEVLPTLWHPDSHKMHDYSHTINVF